MVVVVIIAIVAGTVGVQALNMLENAKIKTTSTQISNLGTALDAYKLWNRQYPSSGEGLQALVSPKSGKPYLDRVPQDEWGNDFIYLYPGSNNSGKYDLMSYGPDGAPGGGDDIANYSTGEPKQ
jgi:general secretion pathway protein G